MPQNVPPFEFFSEDEIRVLQPFVDVVMAQDEEPRIPVLNYIDETLAQAKGQGYRYFALPDDDALWRTVARALELASFDRMSLDEQKQYVDDFSQGKLHGEPWDQINVALTWEIVHRDILGSFYSHPWAWNEIGFGGAAYPRGYTRFGSPHLEDSERESWEPHEALNYDPGSLREGLG